MSSTATEEAVRATPSRWKADLALGVVALVWGTTFVVVKRALTDISTLYFLAARFSIATFCLLLMFLPALRRAGRRPVLRGLRGGAIAGLFLWLGYVLQTLGLKYTTAGNSGFLTGLYIVLVPLLSAAVYRRCPQVMELFGIAVATGGMALLTVPSLHLGVPLNVQLSLRFNRGDLLTIACAGGFAIHLLVLGYFSQRERFEAVALGQIACAAVLSTLSLAIEHPVARWNGNVIFAVLLTAVFATALAFALQTWGQQYTSATRTALIFALEPVFALATAVTVGGEKLTLGAVSGGTMILAGILAVELKPARRP